jgi:hypothetical protein
MTSGAQRKGSSSAQRMRLSRLRKREGFFGTISLDVRQSEVAALIARGFLAAADRKDRGAISDALGRLLDVVLRGAGS